MRHSGRRTKSCACALLASFVAVSIFAIHGCDKDEPAAPIFKSGGILVKVSDCKQFESLAASATSPDLDRVDFSYTQAGVFILKHVNAAFNCCPEEIYVDAQISGDTLTIAEHERARGCHCTCLYDLEYRIPEMPIGAYTIRILEPYTDEGDEPIEFTANLKTFSSGKFSTPRDHYPWREGGGTSTQPTYLAAYRGCMATGECTPSFQYVPSDLDCVEYRGIGGTTLALDHFNAVFTCCPDQVIIDITLSNDTIAIVERESSPPCDCRCVYNVQYQIRNLEPRRYAVSIKEPHVSPAEERIAFDVDLADAPLNFSGVYRDEELWYCASTYAYDTLALGKMRRTILGYIAWYNTCYTGGVCHFIGLGLTPCGGTREYLVYSLAPRFGDGTLDVSVLRGYVCRYDEHELALNHRYGLVSPCPTPAVPRPGCVDGACVDLNGP